MVGIPDELDGRAGRRRRRAAGGRRRRRPRTSSSSPRSGSPPTSTPAPCGSCDELPKGPTGKILRREVHAPARGEHLAARSRMPSASLAPTQPRAHRRPLAGGRAWRCSAVGRAARRRHRALGAGRVPRRDGRPATGVWSGCVGAPFVLRGAGTAVVGVVVGARACVTAGARAGPCCSCSAASRWCRRCSTTQAVLAVVRRARVGCRRAGHPRGVGGLLASIVAGAGLRRRRRAWRAQLGGGRRARRATGEPVERPGRDRRPQRPG